MVRQWLIYPPRCYLWIGGGKVADLWTGLTGAGLSPRTVQLYTRVIWSAEQWFAEQGWKLDRADVAQVVAYARTRPQTYSTLGMLRWALDHYWQMVGHPSPPLKAIRVPPAPRSACLALEEDDARILAKAARARRDNLGFAVCLGLYAGLRREEIASLPWAAFMDNGDLKVVGKGSRTRRFPLHPVIAELADERTQRGRWVFSGRKDGHVCPTTVWVWVRRVAEEAGVPLVRPHRLRHTSLATANDATGDLRAVQDFAGHAKPETTARYTRATSRRLRAVVESIDY